MVSLRSAASLTHLRRGGRRRKLPISPYKGKWQQTFNQQAAMEDFKKATVERQQPNLLFALINSFSIYACDPTPSPYTFLLNTLTQNSQFDQLPPVLHRIEHLEKFDIPEPFFVHLIRTYGRANMLHDAVDIFFRIPRFRCTPSAFSLNALLSVLCKRREGLQMVRQVLLKSHEMNVRLDESSFRILISALCNIKKVAFAIDILNLMSDYGYDPDSTFYSLILSALCKISDLSSAEVLGFLGEMRKAGFSPDGVDYTNVIAFLVKADKGLDALDLLNQMKLDGIKPDVICYTMVLDGVTSAEEFQKAEDVFDEMLVLGVVPDIYTYNVYLSGLFKQNNIEAGFKMLACMDELGCKPNVVTYNTLLGALCRLGEVRQAEEVLRRMRSKGGVQGNLHTYRILIDGFISNGEVMEACRLLEEMLHMSFLPRAQTFDEMICALCKRGLASEALKVLKEMITRNIAPGSSAWEALLSMFELSFKETNSSNLEDLINNFLN